MNFLSIEKLWTENDIVFNMIVIIGYMSSMDNIEDFDINYNLYYQEKTKILCIKIYFLKSN